MLYNGLYHFTFPSAIYKGSNFSIPLPTHYYCCCCFCFLCCFFFLTIAILVGMKGYFIVVLIFISLMNNDVQYLFMCLLAICISSLEKFYSNSLPMFIVVLRVFYNQNQFGSMVRVSACGLKGPRFDSSQRHVP
uniref:Uncharacterized protein n=1 Tax=Pipistrellus kuhlii TaxID=59472 RepID=A0A7J7WLH2_PIPKU|nr:hypothetical protein mPipKuh1_007954 [Pipistrellus kuhlii]